MFTGLASLQAVSTTTYSDPYNIPGSYTQPSKNIPSNSSYYQPGSSGRISWATNYSDAVSNANTLNKPVVILFTGTNWCPACMKLEKEVLTQPEFARLVGSNFVFLKAEFPDYSESSMMGSPYRSIMLRYNVEAFPTFIVINPSGQILGRVDYQSGGPSAYAQALQRFR